MDLRAIYNPSERMKKLTTLILIWCGYFHLFAQSSTAIVIPNEINFVDVRFQLNKSTKYLLNQEVAFLQKNKSFRDENVKKIALIYPTIKPIMDKWNVPSDFLLLSIYHNYQNSQSSNTVLDTDIWWDLDKAKSADINLKINNEVDDRKHLLLATNAAMASIKSTQVIYQNWGSTLFASLADRKVLNFLDISKKWKGEYILLDSPAYTSVLQFLAFKLVVEHDFNGYQNLLPQTYFSYSDGNGKPLNIIAADLKLDPIALANMNPWLKTAKVPDDETPVLVIVRLDELNSIQTYAKMANNKGFRNTDYGFPILKKHQEYALGKGGIFYNINGLKGIQADMCDSYVTLAYKAGISIKRFLSFNDMAESDVVKVGQVYYIEPKDIKASIPHYIAKEGDTFWQIAQNHGIKLKYLLAYNRLNKVSTLENGQLIWLQTERPNGPMQIVQPIIEEQVDSMKLMDEVVEAAIPEQEMVYDRAYADSVMNAKMLASNENEIITNNNEEIVTVIPQKNAPKTDSEEKVIVHEVKPGETLYKISVEYGISIEQLFALNDIKDNRIETGEKIVLRHY